MKRPILLIWIFTVLCGVSRGEAQERSCSQTLSLLWGASVPAGDNFLNRTTFIAPTLEWELRFPKAWAVGISAGVIRGNESGRTSDRFETDFVSGVSSRRLTLVPLTGYGRWYPLTGCKSNFQPYVSVGIGAEFVSYFITGEAINTSKAKRWSYLGTGEIGCRYIFSREGRLSLDLRGSYLLGGSDWETVDKKGDRRFGIALGINIKL